MLTMTIRKQLSLVLIGMLLLGSPALVFARGSRRAAVANTDETTSSGRQSIGAPQVLEIPPVQEITPPTEGVAPSSVPASPERSVAVPSYSNSAARSRGPQELGDETGRIGSTQLPSSTERRNYLGVLYATAEDGANGVKVLDVIPGSPAARAGFEGANTPKTSQSNDFVKIALVALTMSPVGAFAMPLLIAHNMYSVRHQSSPGDLIVAVDDRQVRDAVEFSQEMHRYQPGDTVTFSIVRQGKALQVPVVLEEEPS